MKAINEILEKEMISYIEMLEEVKKALNKQRLWSKITVKCEGQEFTFTKVDKDAYADDFIKDKDYASYGDYRTAESMASWILSDKLRAILD